jgi:hypothetical protein
MGTRFKFSALGLPLDGIPVLGSQHASAYSVIVACIPRRSLSTFVNAFIQYVLMEPPSQVHSSSHYCNRGRLGLSPDPIEPVIISSASAEKFFGFKIVPVYRSCISGCSILLAWAFAEIADRRAISPLTSFELTLAIMKIAKDTPRNLLLCCGAYYISCWVGYPTAVASMPLATAGLHALVAFAAGAIVAWLVDSERPVRWAIFLAVLYVFFGTFGYQLAQQRSFRDRSAQLLGAVIMGVSCRVGAVFTLRGTRYKQPPTPDLSRYR